VECDDSRHQLAAWDPAGFWDFVLLGNPRIGPVTRGFVTAWIGAVRAGRAAAAAESSDLRELVERRERLHKKAQSRLTNDRLLRTWSGAAGSARLTYRWSQVRRIVGDVIDGLDRDAGA
jgi:Family of unknown function (DUF6361)